jgi:uncharacterized membrane protein YhaH (DUF805 family)
MTGSDAQPRVPHGLWIWLIPVACLWVSPFVSVIALLVVTIAFLIVAMRDSELGQNKYGPSPKGKEIPTADARP